MGIRYPGSNMQELNLDWVLSTVKENTEKVDTQLHDLTELEEKVDSAVYSVDNMTVEAETLHPEDDATATKSIINGHINIEFGIPKGEKGDPGPAPTDAQVQSAVNTWLTDNIDPDSGYALDRTLSLSTAAAPADLVGYIKSNIAPEFDSSTNYSIGKLVWYNNSLWQFYQPHPAGAWTGTDVSTAGITALIESLFSDVSLYFDETQAYNVGDYVVRFNMLYRFTSAHTANTAWDSSEVQRVRLANELSDLKSHVNELSGKSNLYVSTYTYNVQPNGNIASNYRALSAPVKINGNGIVFVKKLPSTLHYSVCKYSTDQASSFIGYTDNDWHEVETFIISDPTIKYVRLYFGKKDNSVINDSDFADTEIAVFDDVVTPVYYTGGETAQDKNARAIENEMRKTLSVCSWNVGLWNDGTTPYMTISEKYKWMRVFGEINADIIMTQESPYTVVSGDSVIYPNLFGYKYDYLKNPLAAETVYLSKGIASVFPIANPTRNFFTDNQRSYLKAYIIINDIKICLINCQLSFNSAERAPEITELINVMNGEDYVICCGDFNVEDVNEFDAFSTAGYKMANDGDFGQFVTWDHTTEEWTNGVLDNCIVSSNISITNVRTIDGTGTGGISDHKPIVTTLIIN